ITWASISSPTPDRRIPSSSFSSRSSIIASLRPPSDTNAVSAPSWKIFPFTFSPTRTCFRLAPPSFACASNISAKLWLSGTSSDTLGPRGTGIGFGSTGLGSTGAAPDAASPFAVAAVSAAAPSAPGAGAPGISGASPSGRVSTTPDARFTTTSGPCGFLGGRSRRSPRPFPPRSGFAPSAVGAPPSTGGAAAASSPFRPPRSSPPPPPPSGRSRFGRPPSRSLAPEGIPSITSPKVAAGFFGPPPLPPNPLFSSLTADRSRLREAHRWVLPRGRRTLHEAHRLSEGATRRTVRPGPDGGDSLAHAPPPGPLGPHRVHHLARRRPAPPRGGPRRPPRLRSHQAPHGRRRGALGPPGHRALALRPRRPDVLELRRAHGRPHPHPHRRAPPGHPALDRAPPARPLRLQHRRRVGGVPLGHGHAPAPRRGPGRAPPPHPRGLPRLATHRPPPRRLQRDRPRLRPPRPARGPDLAPPGDARPPGGPLRPDPRRRHAGPTAPLPGPAPPGRHPAGARTRSE